MNHVSVDDFRNYKSQSQRQLIKPASDFLDEAMAMLDDGVHLTGDKLPWEKTHNLFRFRMGEVTIWSGINGNGKSLVMGQAALWLAKDTNVLIASMEMKGSMTIARMLRQGYGGRKPTQDFRQKFEDVTDLRLWIYDQTDVVQSEDIMSMIDWSAEQKGIKHIMIDSLMMCGVDQEQGETQKRFVAELCTKAKEFNIHIHLVTHARKSPVGAKNYIPGKFDISGSASITNLAFNVILIHLNDEKRKAIENKSSYSYTDPDGLFIVDKQRNGEFTGKFGFWFHDESLQWIDNYNGVSMQWL
ncbi:MAG: AAA family ATPase [Candidatus Marinimicrobia bacterium]|jgi:twinkle protein|nr:AAA family ATPase [Candidatus Neomarinimicrobiota bacterium]